MTHRAEAEKYIRAEKIAAMRRLVEEAEENGVSRNGMDDILRTAAV